jgi:hypothetical protein
VIDAILAALCMVAVDVLSVVLVQAEAANRGWLAGLMDVLGWYPSIICTTLCVLALDSHSTENKVAVLVLVGAANLFGTKLGQLLGKRVLGSPHVARMFAKEGPTIDDRVAAIEARLPEDPTTTLAERVSALESLIRKEPV